MSLDRIEKKILEIIHTYREGQPVGIPTIDRLLLGFDEDFILNGLLPEKIKSLENKKLIHSPEKQIGYSLTEKGIEIFKILTNV